MEVQDKRRENIIKFSNEFKKKVSMNEYVEALKAKGFYSFKTGNPDIVRVLKKWGCIPKGIYVR